MHLIFTVYTQMRLSSVCECVCYIKRFLNRDPVHDGHSVITRLRNPYPHLRL
jgi:hypothetical protein